MKIFSCFLVMLLCVSTAIHGQYDLHPGDTIPDMTINNILGYKTSQARLSDFRGKLLILDFWATWCGACIANIPKLDSLGRKFGDRVLFLPVTNEPETLVTEFRRKYAKQYKYQHQGPEVVSDTVLRKLFRYRYLPHYVWIDGKGAVIAITEGDEITLQNITMALENSHVMLSEKRDIEKIPYDKEKPLMANGNGGDGSNLVYHSVLTKYTPGLPGGFNWKFDTIAGRKITITNTGRLWLYRIAFAKPGGWLEDGSIMVEVKDPSKLTTELAGEKYRTWLNEGNGFCYEIIAPPSFDRKINAIMQRDLENFFPEYTAAMEKRKKRCLVLTSLNIKGLLPKSMGGKPEIKIDRFGWKLKNNFISKLVERMNQMQNYPIPIVDETEQHEPVDMEINTGLSDLEGLNRELSQYGLKFTEKELELEVLVIRDAVK